MTIDATRRRSLHRPCVLLLLGALIGMAIAGIAIRETWSHGERIHPIGDVPETRRLP